MTTQNSKLQTQPLFAAHHALRTSPRAAILVGHGSLRLGSGAAMIRLAARVRARGVAPIVEASFLNYSRPTFAQALERCVAQGASDVVVVPYFLIPGKFVGVDLPHLLAQNQVAYPDLPLRLAQPFGDHPALAELAQWRAQTAVTALQPQSNTALLLLAHGSPMPQSNEPIYKIAERIAANSQYAAVQVAFMELNNPSIPDAINALVAEGMQRIIAVPYFLQLGGHVAEDLPAIIAATRTRHPTTEILLADHLGYDPLLAEVIADRFGEAA